MSYMTPYYFTASAGKPISIWMRSSDFMPKVGLTFSGSTTKLAENSESAWQYDSSHSCAAIHYTVPSSSIYKVECSSTGSISYTGSFKLYVTEAETSSLVTTNNSAPWRLVYSPIANRIFSTDWTLTAGSCSVSIIDPQTSTEINSFQYTSSVMLDVIYNSTDDTVCVWVSSSAGQFLDEYDASGSVLLDRKAITIDWAGNTTDLAGVMAYNDTLNQVLLVPSINNSVAVLSWSVYDFASQTNIYSALPAHAVHYPVYVPPPTASYYIFTQVPNYAIKIDATTFSQSIPLNISGSAYGATYISQVDRIFCSDNNGAGGVVYDPRTDSLTDIIPGIIDFQFATYDTCNDCIVISDDAAGDPTYTQGGGLCYVNTNSYQPLNFIHLYGVQCPVFCDGTSTVWTSNYYDNNLISVFTSIGTGSLLQPPYPSGSVDPYDNILYLSGSEETITNPVGNYSRTNSTWKEIHGHNCTGLTGLLAGSNQLHTVDLVNCTSLNTLGLDINNLGQAAVDTVLSDLVDSGVNNGNIWIADSGNSHPSAAGSASAVTLASRGWGVFVRWTPRPNHLILDTGAEYYDPADVDTENPTGMIDVGMFNNYTECSAISCTSMTHLTCSNNWINKINISGSSLVGLNCSDNFLATMSMEAPNLTYLNCSTNVYATSLDLSYSPSLQYIKCSGMSGLTALDLSGKTSLTYVDCRGCGALASVDFTGCTALISASCNSNASLTSLDVSTNTSLGYLACQFNGLTSLNVSGTLLKRLLFDNNQLNQAAVDTVLTTIDSFGTNSGSIRMGGTNAAPSITGYNATASMKTRKWTFTVM